MDAVSPHHGPRTTGVTWARTERVILSLTRPVRRSGAQTTRARVSVESLRRGTYLIFADGF